MGDWCDAVAALPGLPPPLYRHNLGPRSEGAHSRGGRNPTAPRGWGLIVIMNMGQEPSPQRGQGGCRGDGSSS